MPSAETMYCATPSKELKGARLFRAIGRRLARSRVRSAEDDGRSSSTDSSSSESQRAADSGSNSSTTSSTSSGFRSASPYRSSSSDAGSLARVFAGLTLGPRSKEAGKRKKATAAAPKKILRQPVSYAYVRGMSGLPTQRVPRGCGCTYTSSLHA